MSDNRIPRRLDEQPLPGTWRWVPLRQIGAVIRGVTFPAGEGLDDPTDGSVACLTTSAVQDDIDWATRRFIPERRVVSNDQFLRQNDLLVSTANTKELVGKSAFVNHVPFDCTFGAFVTVVRPNYLIHPRMLAYWLRTPEVLQYFYRMSSNTTNISNLRTSDLLALPVPLAPLSEQQRIVDILDAAEQLRRKRAEADKLADQLVPALFYEMFGDPDPVRNDRGWEVVTLGGVIDVGTGGTPSRSRSTFYGGPHYWVKTTELRDEVLFNTDETLTEQGLRSSNAKIYPQDTILVAMYGQGQTRGRTAKLGVPAATNQACAAFPPSAEIQPNYLWYWFQLSYERIRRLGRGGPQENLNLEILKRLRVPKPPDALQRRFAAFVDANSSYRQQRTTASTTVDEFRGSLLARAFTGELTAPWREAHREQLAREAVERDQWLAEAGTRPSVFTETGTVTGKMRVSGEDVYIPHPRHALLDALSIRQRELFQVVGTDEEYVTPERLRADGVTADLARRGLELLAAMGLVAGVDVLTQGENGKPQFARAYRGLRMKSETWLGDDARLEDLAALGGGQA